MRIKEKELKKWMPFAVFFVLAVPMLFRELGSGDELWNYNFAINVSRGMVPYKDFSMVQTSLSAFFSAIVLLVLGNSLISFRIAGMVLIAVTFALMFLVCKMITGREWLSWVVCSFAYAVVYHLWIYNYNYLILLGVILIFYLELKGNTRMHRVIAFLYGVFPLIKQSTGGLLLLLFFAGLLFDFFRTKEARKDILYNFVVSLIPGSIFMLYLLVTESLDSFWEYAISGVSTFTHRIYIWDYVVSFPMAIIFVAFIALSIVLSLVTIAKRKDNRKYIHIKFLLIALVAGVVGYPLTDHHHMTIAIVPYIVCFLLCFHYDKKYSSSQKVACLGVAIVILIFSSSVVLSDAGDLQMSQLPHYRGVPIDPNVEKNIILVQEFILAEEEEGNRVVIADECAALCMIPLDKYTKNFDMFLVGNLGNNSIQDLLGDDDNVIYLVARDESTLGYQAHHDFVRYVKNNYKKVGEVSGLDAYEKQN